MKFEIPEVGTPLYKGVCAALLKNTHESCVPAPPEAFAILFHEKFILEPFVHLCGHLFLFICEVCHIISPVRFIPFLERLASIPLIITG